MKKIDLVISCLVDELCNVYSFKSSLLVNHIIHKEEFVGVSPRLWHGNFISSLDLGQSHPRELVFRVELGPRFIALHPSRFIVSNVGVPSYIVHALNV